MSMANNNDNAVTMIFYPGAKVRFETTYGEPQTKTGQVIGAMPEGLFVAMDYSSDRTFIPWTSLKYAVVNPVN